MPIPPRLAKCVRLHQRFAWATFVVLSATAPVIAFSPDREDERFFESQVRPLLVENCQKCHGPEQQKGGLRLDVRELAFAGGKSGPAFEPGRPDDSLLIEAVRYDGLKMPPKKPLSADQVRVLERWIERGAVWPSDGNRTSDQTIALRNAGSQLSAIDRAWWAIQPIHQPKTPLPELDLNWCSNPIDAFVSQQHTKNGLGHAPEADRAALLRRLNFDLTGLPPSPEEIASFVADPRPDAYEKRVERLLNSPQFGERWARHWLDLVRYSESDGYKQDTYRPESWRYRDYVLTAFNRDLPYDRFLTEQLAGDELNPDDPSLRVATTYLRLWPYEYNQRDVEGQWDTILNDLTDVTADVFLGIGLSCARCHDHKFDPLLQTDYFRLQAFFAPLLPRDDLPLANPTENADALVSGAAWDLLTADLREQIALIEQPHKQAARADAIAKFQPHLQVILNTPEADRSPRERQLAYLMQRQLVEEFGNIQARIKGEEKQRYDQLQAQLRKFDAIRPRQSPTAFCATDLGTHSPRTLMPGRRETQDVSPGFPTILHPDPAAIETPPPGVNSTGRRLALARWMTSPENPLVPRVIANRLWQYHFGRGLVATSSDFGRLGESPSHPALLDWLAFELANHEWSLKHLHRLIVTSATYRQGAQQDSAAENARRIDPENRWLWERRPTRLEAEPLRDAMLFTSGELLFRIGGPAVEAAKPRRTLYTRQTRNSPDSLLAAFDAPDGSTSLPTRNVTTTPTQALDLLNGSFTLARAEALAQRLEHDAPSNLGLQVDRLFMLALGKLPSAAERVETLAFLDAQAARSAANLPAPQKAHLALTDLCHAFLNSSAFLYVE